MRRVHKAHELVTHLCGAWGDKEAARIQSGIIVRELCRVGMLVDGELCGMVVIEASGQRNSPAQVTKPTSTVQADAVADGTGIIS